VINTAAQRCKAVGLLLVDVRVQGDGAAQEIARAIRWVDRHHQRLGVEAILVTRGGGSIEDLWAFNERIVAEAVFACGLPVVAAIGHESDTTIIELVADLRASTPTQAVMRLVPSALELCRQIDHLSERLRFTIARMLQHKRQRTDQLSGDLRRIITTHLAGLRARLERLTAHLTSLQPRAQLTQRQARLAVLADRLNRAITLRIDRRAQVQQLAWSIDRSAHRHVRRLRDRLNSMEQRLIAMDPDGVLRRGYSITMFREGIRGGRGGRGGDRNGALIRSIAQITPGQPITTRIADGSFDSIVDKTDVRSGGQARAIQRQTAPARPHEPRAQLDLFNAPPPAQRGEGSLRTS
jgi:exodeoxyribonuclease VII large subunit